MGLFSGIGKALFGDPTKGIASARDQTLGYQQKGTDYATAFNQPMLDARNQALPMLSNFYGGGEGQQSFVDDTMASPFYNQMIQTGQEGVLANAGDMGLTRSGNTAQDLAQSNQGVLQNLTNQRLGGLTNMANMNIDPSLVTNQYNQMGGTVGNAQTAMNQAQQSQMGDVMGLITGGLSGAGNLGWKPFG